MDAAGLSFHALRGHDRDARPLLAALDRTLPLSASSFRPRSPVDARVRLLDPVRNPASLDLRRGDRHGLAADARFELRVAPGLRAGRPAPVPTLGVPVRA